MQYCKNVTLRERKLAHDKISLYLDYYPGVRDKVTMKIIRREYLGIYIYANPKNKMERAFNRRMREKAEMIRCQRYESVVRCVTTSSTRRRASVTSSPTSSAYL